LLRGWGCLNIKSFYKTQRELADVLNQLIDKYWGNDVNEDELLQHINSLYINNPGKMKKGEQYTSILQQICGKRRLEVINRILNMTDNANN
jgi:uncharacterized protein (TIGR04540 family)